MDDIIREAFSLRPVRHMHPRSFKKCDQIVREFLMCPVPPECVLCIIKCSLRHVKHVLLMIMHAIVGRDINLISMSRDHFGNGEWS